MSWKTKYLEAENERLRKREEILLAALLERAGHRASAEILRAEQTIGVASRAAEAATTAKANAVAASRPQGRSGWRGIQKRWQDMWYGQAVDEAKAEEAKNNA